MRNSVLLPLFVFQIALAVPVPPNPADGKLLPPPVPSTDFRTRCQKQMTEKHFEAGDELIRACEDVLEMPFLAEARDMQVPSTTSTLLSHHVFHTDTDPAATAAAAAPLVPEESGASEIQEPSHTTLLSHHVFRPWNFPSTSTMAPQPENLEEKDDAEKEPTFLNMELGPLPSFAPQHFDSQVPADQTPEEVQKRDSAIALPEQAGRVSPGLSIFPWTDVIAKIDAESKAQHLEQRDCIGDFGHPYQGICPRGAEAGAEEMRRDQALTGPERNFPNDNGKQPHWVPGWGIQPPPTRREEDASVMRPPPPAAIDAAVHADAITSPQPTATASTASSVSVSLVLFTSIFTPPFASTVAATSTSTSASTTVVETTISTATGDAIDVPFWPPPWAMPLLHVPESGAVSVPGAGPVLPPVGGIPSTFSRMPPPFTTTPATAAVSPTSSPSNVFTASASPPWAMPLHQAPESGAVSVAGAGPVLPPVENAPSTSTLAPVEHTSASTAVAVSPTPFPSGSIGAPSSPPWAVPSQPESGSGPGFVPGAGPVLPPVGRGGKEWTEKNGDWLGWCIGKRLCLAAE